MPGLENDRFSPGRNPPSPLSSGHAKAQVVVPVLRIVPVAVRRPTVLRLAVPAPAADHPPRSLRSPTTTDPTTPGEIANRRSLGIGWIATIACVQSKFWVARIPPLLGQDISPPGSLRLRLAGLRPAAPPHRQPSLHEPGSALDRDLAQREDWTRATRKPRKSPRSSGTSPLRFDDRQRCGSPCQLPPRITRLAAWGGPDGSSSGDCL
jgi:hypothetical protein